jgi:hypothetical protein
MTPLPHLSDDEKQKLCLELEAAGLVQRNAGGRWSITIKGHLAGAMLMAKAQFEAAISH